MDSVSYPFRVMSPSPCSLYIFLRNKSPGSSWYCNFVQIRFFYTTTINIPIILDSSEHDFTKATRIFSRTVGRAQFKPTGLLLSGHVYGQFERNCDHPGWGEIIKLNVRVNNKFQRFKITYHWTSDKFLASTMSGPSLFIPFHLFRIL